MRIELIHPMIVHFPIVLAICLFALDGFASISGRTLTGGSPVGNTSAALSLAAGLFAVLAFIFGDQAYDIAVAAGRAPEALLEMHQDLGTTVAFALAGWAVVRAFLWWRATPLDGAARLALTAAEGILVLAVLVTAWYGGQLVYDHGVAVQIAPGG